MVHIQINPHSGVPAYRQVMDQIRYYAASGALKAGQQLPSIRELSRALSINPATVVKAYAELQHEGAIDVRQGKGAFVAVSVRALSRAQMRKALRGLARQLAVEAAQMGASTETVLNVLRGEMERFDNERQRD